MPTAAHISPDEIRKGFSKAMSDMYRDEVPLYGALMELVAETNTRVLDSEPGLAQQLQRTGAWTSNATVPSAWARLMSWPPLAACLR